MEDCHKLSPEPGILDRNRPSPCSPGRPCSRIPCIAASPGRPRRGRTASGRRADMPGGAKTARQTMSRRGRAPKTKKGSPSAPFPRKVRDGRREPWSIPSLHDAGDDAGTAIKRGVPRLIHFTRLSPRARGFDHSTIEATTPAPTVRPPSRMAKRSFSSIAIGTISATSIVTLSPGITISVPSGSVQMPVTSVVRK